MVLREQSECVCDMISGSNLSVGIVYLPSGLKMECYM